MSLVARISRIVAAGLLAVMVFFNPARAETPREKVSTTIELSAESSTPPQSEWSEVAQGPTGRWSGSGAYSVYADGEFDLSGARSIRITFPANQAGTKFRLRLVPKDTDFNQPIGLRSEIVTIPADGIVTLPLDPAEFGLDAEAFKSLVQITVLSGDNSWGNSMGQAATRHAVFTRIEISAARAARSTSPASQSAPAPESGWQVVADRPTGQPWTDDQAYSVYADGNFDLSDARVLRLTFPVRQAGLKFRLRLLPKGSDPTQPGGVRWEPITIPADGVVTLPFNVEEFKLRPASLKTIVQITILSGDNSWNEPMGQPASNRVVFPKIEKSRSRAGVAIGQIKEIIVRISVVGLRATGALFGLMVLQAAMVSPVSAESLPTFATQTSRIGSASSIPDLAVLLALGVIAGVLTILFQAQTRRAVGARIRTLVSQVNFSERATNVVETARALFSGLPLIEIPLSRSTEERLQRETQRLGAAALLASA